MTNQEAFMNLKVAYLSEAKWVWTKVAYLWVSGANYKLKFDRIARTTEVFRGVSMCFVG